MYTQQRIYTYNTGRITKQKKNSNKNWAKEKNMQLQKNKQKPINIFKKR